MTERTGCKILVKGRGSQKDQSRDMEDDDLHVLLEGTEDSVEKAVREVEEILYNPARAMQLKQAQLGDLAEQKGGGSGFGGSSSNIYGPGLGSTEHPVMVVPNNLVGLIIGKGGEQIQNLQRQSGGNVQIQKGKDML
jgi:KH domain